MGIIIWLAAWALIAFAISRKSKSFITIIGGSFFSSLVILIIFFADLSKLLPNPYADAIDICTMAQAFQKNEMAAIAEYEDKKFIIKGIAGIKGSNLAGLYLQFPCGNIWPAAQCHFKKSNASDLARISPGQTVFVKGKCAGKTLGTILFENCSIVTG